jgi:hypothetical protein
MDKPGPLTAQIAASIDDVKALLDDNRSLSIAYLARRLKDFEEQTAKRLDGIDKAVKKISERVDKAGAEFKKLRDESKGK